MPVTGPDQHLAERDDPGFGDKRRGSGPSRMTQAGRTRPGGVDWPDDRSKRSWIGGPRWPAISGDAGPGPVELARLRPAGLPGRLGLPDRLVSGPPNGKWRTIPRPYRPLAVPDGGESRSAGHRHRRPFSKPRGSPTVRQRLRTRPWDAYSPHVPALRQELKEPGEPTTASRTSRSAANLHRRTVEKQDPTFPGAPCWN